MFDFWVQLLDLMRLGNIFFVFLEVPFKAAKTPLLFWNSNFFWDKIYLCNKLGGENFPEKMVETLMRVYVRAKTIMPFLSG